MNKNKRPRAYKKIREYKFVGFMVYLFCSTSSSVTLYFPWDESVKVFFFVWSIERSRIDRRVPWVELKWKEMRWSWLDVKKRWNKTWQLFIFLSFRYRCTLYWRARSPLSSCPRQLIREAEPRIYICSTTCCKIFILDAS